MRTISYIFTLLLLPFLVMAATNDFVASSNVTVSDVTFGVGTTNLLIFSGSTAESIITSTTLTVTNPGSSFHVGSADASVASVRASLNGDEVSCGSNSTPGASYLSLPTTAGVYVVTPSSSSCMCPAIVGAESYNSHPTCGAASCSSGYSLSGSGSGATCYNRTPGGSPASINLSRIQSPIPVNTNGVAAYFSATLPFGSTGEDVRRLQTLLASDKTIYPEGITSGYFGPLTREAVEKFQLKYGVVAGPGVPGYGVFGPATRAKILEVFGN